MFCWCKTWLMQILRITAEIYRCFLCEHCVWVRRIYSSSILGMYARKCRSRHQFLIWSVIGFFIWIEPHRQTFLLNSTHSSNRNYVSIISYWSYITHIAIFIYLNKFLLSILICTDQSIASKFKLNIHSCNFEWQYLRVPGEILQVELYSKKN